MENLFHQAHLVVIGVHILVFFPKAILIYILLYTIVPIIYLCKLYFLFFRHPIIKKLHKLLSSDKELANMVTQQLFSNAMVTAGLVVDPRNLITHINDLLVKALEKH